MLDQFHAVSSNHRLSYKRRAVGLALLAVMLGLFLMPSTTAHARVQEKDSPAVAAQGGTQGLLVNVHSGKCLDVVNNSTSDGANVQQYVCHGGPNQQWLIVPIPNDFRFQLINVNSRKCLDVAWGSTSNGANIQQYTCHGGPNQSWQLRSDGAGGFDLVNRNSLKCADVAGGSKSDGANVQQYTCHNGPNQRWRFSSVTPTPTPTPAPTSTPAPVPDRLTMFCEPGGNSATCEAQIRNGSGGSAIGDYTFSWRIDRGSGSLNGTFDVAIYRCLNYRGGARIRVTAIHNSSGRTLTATDGVSCQGGVGL